jgi:hypothetical protein
MVFDEWQNGIPVAFVITNRCKEEDLLPWMTKLRDSVEKQSPGWCPNVVIVDCAQAELNVIG